jgi:hypothetical protein
MTIKNESKFFEDVAAVVNSRINMTYSAVLDSFIEDADTAARNGYNHIEIPGRFTRSGRPVEVAFDFEPDEVQ